MGRGALANMPHFNLAFMAVHSFLRDRSLESMRRIWRYCYFRACDDAHLILSSTETRNLTPLVCQQGRLFARRIGWHCRNHRLRKTIQWWTDCGYQSESHKTGWIDFRNSDKTYHVCRPTEMASGRFCFELYPIAVILIIHRFFSISMYLHSYYLHLDRLSPLSSLHVYHQNVSSSPWQSLRISSTPSWTRCCLWLPLACWVALREIKAFSATSIAACGSLPSFATFSPCEARFTPGLNRYEYAKWLSYQNRGTSVDFGVEVDNTHLGLNNVRIEKARIREQIGLNCLLRESHHINHLMEMCCEQRPAPVLVIKMEDSSESDGKAVMRCSAPTDFIHYDLADRLARNDCTKSCDCFTKLRSVEFRRISPVSSISTMKVLRSRNKSSLAPTLEKTLSTSPISARSAGTKHPAWAKIAIRAVWRRNVDFPAMFGPVMTCNREELSIHMVLDVKVLPEASRPCSTVGWRPLTTKRFMLTIFQIRLNSAAYVGLPLRHGGLHKFHLTS